jgi:hypothetical protein
VLRDLNCLGVACVEDNNLEFWRVKLSVVMRSGCWPGRLGDLSVGSVFGMQIFLATNYTKDTNRRDSYSCLVSVCSWFLDGRNLLSPTATYIKA